MMAERLGRVDPCWMQLPHGRSGQCECADGINLTQIADSAAIAFAHYPLAKVRP